LFLPLQQPIYTQNTKAMEEKGKAKEKGESKKRYLDV